MCVLFTERGGARKLLRMSIEMMMMMRDDDDMKKRRDDDDDVKNLVVVE